MSNQLVYITEEKVRELLDWKSVILAVENALMSISKETADQCSRTLTKVLGTKNMLFCMPAYVKNDCEEGILSCKMVTSFPENKNKTPSLLTIDANVFLFNELTGKLKCILEGNEITAWRTAGTSIVATKYLYFGDNKTAIESNVLAIMGAGIQARIHAVGFYHEFKFKEIRVWNHRVETAIKLVNELKEMGLPALVHTCAKNCVKNADVIITATYATTPIVQYEWIKPTVHINAIGVGVGVNEISEDIYKNASIYVECMTSAKNELKNLFDMNMDVVGTLGDVIIGDKLPPQHDKITIFQSLGMAAEDAFTGNLVYNRYIASQK